MLCVSSSGSSQLRAAGYAGVNTRRIRFAALLFCALCATMAGLINIAYFRSFNPVAGANRELDGIASVIIGGGSIFGGFGTIIGSLAGAAVITLVRALMQLNIIVPGGNALKKDKAGYYRSGGWVMDKTGKAFGKAAMNYGKVRAIARIALRFYWGECLLRGKLGASSESNSFIKLT